MDPQGSPLIIEPKLRSIPVNISVAVLRNVIPTTFNYSLVTTFNYSVESDGGEILFKANQSSFPDRRSL